jgi:hypothetical protein
MKTYLGKLAEDTVHYCNHLMFISPYFCSEKLKGHSEERNYYENILVSQGEGRNYSLLFGRRRRFFFTSVPVKCAQNYLA